MRRDLDSLVTQMHSTGIRYEDAVKEFKRQYLREVLAANKGNQCKAAEELGIHRNTLSRTMAELGISLAEIRAGLKRPPRSERPVFGAARQGIRQVVVRVRITRLHPQCRLEFGNRLRQPAGHSL